MLAVLPKGVAIILLLRQDAPIGQLRPVALQLFQGLPVGILSPQPDLGHAIIDEVMCEKGEPEEGKEKHEASRKDFNEIGGVAPKPAIKLCHPCRDERTDGCHYRISHFLASS